MDQTPYLLWAKQKPNNTSIHRHPDHVQLRASGSTNMAYTKNDESSWEEQAFAEDTFGGGGCVWPPRSYSCSFCRREFRSAQALGGHMNVHRRDRARLKQSSPTIQSQLLDQNHHLGFDQNLHFLHLRDHHRPSSVCSLVFDHDRHHQPNPKISRVCDQEIVTRSPMASSLTTWENFFVGRDSNTSEYPKPKVANLNCVKTGLSVSLSLVLHQTHDPILLSDHDDDEEEGMMRSCKKRRRSDSIIDDSSLPIFLKRKIQTLDHSESEEYTSDLDLELRLGSKPP